MVDLPALWFSIWGLTTSQSCCVAGAHVMWFGALLVSSGEVWYTLLEPWASCQIRKIAGAHAPGMPGTFSPSSQVSDPDMHHGTCVTHVPWCKPGSLTSGFLWNWRGGGGGGRSRHSRRMRNLQFSVSGKRPMGQHTIFSIHVLLLGQWMHLRLRLPLLLLMIISCFSFVCYKASLISSGITGGPLMSTHSCVQIWWLLRKCGAYAGQKSTAGLSPSYHLRNHLTNTIYLEPITNEEIRKIIMSLKQGAPGYDEIKTIY